MLEVTRMLKNILPLMCLILISVSSISFTQNLNPGDGVRVFFYNITEKITGEYYIQDDSTLNLPYIGKIKAVGLNISNLKSEIYSRYSQVYKNP